MNKLFLKLRIWRLENKLQETCEDIGFYQAAINADSFSWRSERLSYSGRLGELKIRKEFLTAKLERLKSELENKIKSEQIKF